MRQACSYVGEGPAVVLEHEPDEGGHEQADAEEDDPHGEDQADAP